MVMFGNFIMIANGRSFLFLRSFWTVILLETLISLSMAIITKMARYSFTTTVKSHLALPLQWNTSFDPLLYSMQTWSFKDMLLYPRQPPGNLQCHYNNATLKTPKTRRPAILIDQCILIKVHLYHTIQICFTEKSFQTIDTIVYQSCINHGR